MLKKKLPILILLCLLLAGMFLFSAQDAPSSSKVSGEIVDFLCNLGLPVTDHLVRKTAHFLEFMVLGILMYLLIPRFYSWIFCILIAMADEFHQLFVSGRGSQWADVALDSAGALFGILLIWCIGRLKARIPKNRKK